MNKKIIMIVLVLLIFGLINVYSSSCIWANYKYNDSLYFFKRQLIFVILGVITMMITSTIDYHLYKKYHKVILLICLLLMILVLIPGIGMVRGGSRSWFNLGLFALQPSELLKVGLIIYSANYIEKHYHKMRTLKVGLHVLIITLLSFGLIMLQPDFGSGVVMVCGVLVMLIVSPFQFKYFIYLGILGIIGMTGMIISAPYRMKRILSFLDPFSDPLGAGFQAIQALYAIIPGGLLGAGFNNSIQKHFYLPEPQTDFIFAIICEEYGFLGATALIITFAYLFYYMFQISKQCDELFGSLMIVGITSMIGIQTMINLGVVVGLLPVTGVTLPFISYGGTSLITTLASIGIILNISNIYKK